ncbi:hypothetical protein [Metallibacterium scheffleri]
MKLLVAVDTFNGRRITRLIGRFFGAGLLRSNREPHGTFAHMRTRMFHSESVSLPSIHSISFEADRDLD